MTKGLELVVRVLRYTPSRDGAERRFLDMGADYIGCSLNQLSGGRFGGSDRRSIAFG